MSFVSMKRCPQVPGHMQHGFILVATLWILAVITIAAGYFAERVNRSISQAQQIQNSAEQLVEFADTRAEILFRFGTTHFSLYGLGEPPAISLDDRPYRGTGEDIVRFQDMRGLLNVNFVERQMLMNLLGQLGVPAEKCDPMLDTLLDYIDNDDLRRLNGAEAPEYAAQGLPLPPNEWLATPHQLKNIIGWRDQPELWENQRLLRLMTTSRIAGFNPNTAPLEALTSLPGVTRVSAAEIIKLRSQKPFNSVAQLTGLIPGVMDSESILFFPAESIRITQQGRKLPWALQFSLTLTPVSETKPWRVDYTSKTAVTYMPDNVEKIQKLPTQTAKPTNAADML